MNECVFCNIRDRKIPKKFTYEDEDVMVFPDIYPIKPVHLLVVPKKHIPDFSDFTNFALLEKLVQVIQEAVKKEKLTKRGYRLVVNGGGAQIVNHLHFHIMGPMGKAVAE